MTTKRPFFKDNDDIRANEDYYKRFRVLTKVDVFDSEVYFCKDSKLNQTVVLKAERIGAQKRSRLQDEWTLYEKLSKNKDFDIVLDHFIGIDHKFLILKKRGDNLRQFYDKQKKSGLWDDKCLKLYAVQMIEGLEKCHNSGVIHLDPKPSNYVLDEQNEEKIYLIDFDCAKEYIDANGEHIPYRTGLQSHELRGNRYYMSINGHKAVEQSRRDDMEFLGYSLIWMFRGRLPWSGKKVSDFESRQQYYDWIKEQKMNYSLEMLCKDSEELVQYMKYCTEMGFKDKPDYQYLISLFN